MRIYESNSTKSLPADSIKQLIYNSHFDKNYGYLQ